MIETPTSCFALAIACLCASACAGERAANAPSRASDVVGVARADRASLPLPETAFREPLDSSNAAPGCEACAREPASRFQTRRIGEDDVPRATLFRGARVDLDLKAVDLQDVFRLLADVGKINIVVAGEVTGTVTMRLRRVPWDQALDVVARAKGLALEREGNVILVRVAAAKDARAVD